MEYTPYQPPPSVLMPKFMLRMSEELRHWLKIKAANNRRSMNNEILLILEERMKAEQAAPK